MPPPAFKPNLLTELLSFRGHGRDDAQSQHERPHHAVLHFLTSLTFAAYGRNAIPIPLRQLLQKACCRAQTGGDARCASPILLNRDLNLGSSRTGSNSTAAVIRIREPSRSSKARPRQWKRLSRS